MVCVMNLVRDINMELENSFSTKCEAIGRLAMAEMQRQDETVAEGEDEDEDTKQ